MEAKAINKILNTLPIAAWPWPRILVGILLERAIGHANKCFHAFIQIAAQGPAILDVDYGRTDVIRNKMACMLLQNDYTHLLMLDIDHKHPTNIIQMLARWPMQDAKKFQVVGGLNFRRAAPYDPCCFLIGDKGIAAPASWTQGELMEVDAIGTGSILIAREVFEQLEPPWFFNIYNQVWEDAWPGEDMGFSVKCREAGIKMWVDTSVSSPHLTDALVTEETFRSYLETSGAQVVDLEKIGKRVTDEG